MADPKEFLSDPNIMTDLNQTDSSLVDNIFSTDTDNLQMIDSFLTNVSLGTEPTVLGESLTDTLADLQSHEQESSLKEADKDSCNSSEVQHVESPTATAEGFAFKCIYCDHVLTASDNPKLLECLHNACMNCINGKLFENNESSGSAGISGGSNASLASMDRTPLADTTDQQINKGEAADTPNTCPIQTQDVADVHEQHTQEQSQKHATKRKALTNAERQRLHRAKKRKDVNEITALSKKSSFHKPRTGAERQRLYRANQKLQRTTKTDVHSDTQTQEDKFTQTQEDQHVQAIDNQLNRNQITCPTCNIQCEASRLIENHFLIELTNSDESSNASKVTDLKCSSCSDEAPASSYCADCSEFICDNCVQAHQRLKITKDHTIKCKEEGINELNALNNGHASLFCANHPHEKLSLFCETCDKLTCRDCQLIEHREHKYQFTNEIASEAKKSISDMLKDVGYKRALLTSAMKVIDDRQSLITEKKQALVKEITQLVVKLTQTVSTRGKQLVGKLTEVCDSKQKTLQEKKLALEQLSKMTDHCIEFTQYALDHGNDMALLYSKKQVTEHLKRIKCKRADIPNPEIPVRIHLALDKVPDLIKVMSTIGQIVVDGRVYPSQATSPGVSSYHPNQSPSPVQMRPTSQQSPISLLVQRTSPSGFPPSSQQQQQSQVGIRMGNPPLYGQYTSNNQQYSQLMQSISQNNNPNLSQQFGSNINSLQNRMPSMGPPNLNNMQLSAISLTRMQRPILQRSPMPRMSNNHMGLNQQQQQVSSSTHPHGMMHDRSNLRHLLQPHNSNAIYIQTGPSQYQAIQSSQFQCRFPNPSVRFSNQQPQQVRMVIPAQQGQGRMIVQGKSQSDFANSTPVGTGAKWHTPQQTNDSSNQLQNRSGSSMPTINDNFKITLRQQPETSKNTPATVTSTIPKTPSPNHIQGHQDTERSLDKFCEESVKDLMATIAKLDSNGVQVLAEGRQKGGSPHVDSSTGDATPAPKIKAEMMETSKDDPNEDWCAVCMDGGELVCCDKCPKVFHQYCHIPNLSVEENDTWQCLLCINFSEIPENLLHEKTDQELSVRERKIAERLVLELYCQYETSLPFREIIGPENTEYHEIIKKPIALDVIRQKLNWNVENHYRNVDELVKDVRLMFMNAYTFNSVDSQVYSDAKTLEKFFDEQLEKFLPEYVHQRAQIADNEDDLHPPGKKYRRIIND